MNKEPKLTNFPRFLFVLSLMILYWATEHRQNNKTEQIKQIELNPNAFGMFHAISAWDTFCYRLRFGNEQFARWCCSDMCPYLLITGADSPRPIINVYISRCVRTFFLVCLISWLELSEKWKHRNSVNRLSHAVWLCNFFNVPKWEHAHKNQRHHNAMAMLNIEADRTKNWPTSLILCVWISKNRDLSPLS